jgi:hypothetical protein
MLKEVWVIFFLTQLLDDQTVFSNQNTLALLADEYRVKVQFNPSPLEIKESKFTLSKARLLHMHLTYFILFKNLKNFFIQGI